MKRLLYQPLPEECIKADSYEVSFQKKQQKMCYILDITETQLK